MENQEKLVIKINHLTTRIQEIQTKIDKHNEQVRECQETILKYDVDIEIANSIYRDTDKQVKLLNERDKYKSKLSKLEIISFVQEENDKAQLNNMLEVYKAELKSEQKGDELEEFGINEGVQSAWS